VPVIDAQVHAYEKDHPGRPWAAVLRGPPSVTGEEMIAAMDEVGVDAAILVSAFTMYRYDPSYAVSVRNAYPGRFALVRPVDPADPAVADTIAEWAKVPGAAGVRIMMRGAVAADAADPGLNRVLAEAGRHGLAVNLLAYGRLPQAKAMAERNPGTQIVIDHVGMAQPHLPPAPPEPFADLPNVLALAGCPNVAIKITGACTYSREAFPYQDIRAPLGRIFEAFGLERCLWGTDWTRAVDILTYRQGVEAFLDSGWLSDADRAVLMGGAAEKVYRWTPSKG